MDTDEVTVTATQKLILKYNNNRNELIENINYIFSKRYYSTLRGRKITYFATWNNQNYKVLQKFKKIHLTPTINV